MLVPPESPSAVLVMVRACPCLSATVLLLDQSIVAEIAHFKEVPKFDAPVRRTEDSLNLRGPNVKIYVQC